MQLRSFSGYAKVAPYIPFAQGCALVNLDGYVAAAGWLQFHDKASAPSANAVPLKSINIAAAGPMPSWLPSLGVLSFVNGLCLAMSSTEGTYTAVATSFDAEGEIEEFEQPVSGLSTATIPADAQLAVWSEAGGPKALYDLSVTNGEGAAVWVHIHARDTVANGAKPFASLLVPLTGLADGSTFKWRFGTSGLSPKVMVVPTLYQACTVILSSTPETTTLSLGAASLITAHYK